MHFYLSLFILFIVCSCDNSINRDNDECIDLIVTPEKIIFKQSIYLKGEKKNYDNLNRLYLDLKVYNVSLKTKFFLYDDVLLNNTIFYRNSKNKYLMKIYNPYNDTLILKPKKSKIVRFYLGLYSFETLSDCKYKSDIVNDINYQIIIQKKKNSRIKNIMFQNIPHNLIKVDYYLNDEMINEDNELFDKSSDLPEILGNDPSSF